MSIPSVYINLDDDVAKVAARIKKVSGDKLVLVCPRRCLLFSDSINLRLLKKQTDLLNKQIQIMTMDEKGQMYAKEAGFELRFLPKAGAITSVADIRSANSRLILKPAPTEKVQPAPQGLIEKVRKSKTVKTLITPFEPSFTVEHVPPVVNSLKNFDFFKTTEASASQKIDSENTLGFDLVAKPPKPKISKWVIGFFILAVLLAAVVFFIILPKADVVIYPRTEPITRDMEITLSAQANSPDSAKLILPAEKIEETVELNNTFQSQGKKEVGNKSSGMVRIYNFTRQPLNLKAATTTLTLGNKTYILSQDMLGVRPTEYKNPTTKEVNPDSLDEPVMIFADAGGEGYNLPAGTRMEITNQVFGSKPQFLYAKTETAITGGTSRYLSVISDADITDAQNSLKEKIIQQLNDKFAREDKIMNSKAFIAEPISFATSKPAGTESQNFDATLKLKISGLVYARQQLKNLVLSRITQSLSNDRELIESVPKWEDSVKIKTIDLTAQSAVMLSHFEGKAVTAVDFSDLNKSIRAMSQSEALESLKTNLEIDKVEIFLSPSWQRFMPLLSSKINVEIQK